jgi:fimbrial chaperone protein
VLVEIAAPGAAGTLTLRNSGTAPLAAQLRLYRWTQSGGEECLDPTDEVVAAPPAIELRPQQDYLVRIVRVSSALSPARNPTASSSMNCPTPCRARACSS